MSDLSVVIAHDSRSLDEQLFADAAIYNREVFSNIDVEWIFVEWGADRYLRSLELKYLLPWWSRFFVVGRNWHEKLSTNSHLFYLEHFARNIGIRRASGRFILVTRSGVKISSEIAERIRRGLMKERTLYRAILLGLESSVGEIFSNTANSHPPFFSHQSGYFIMMDSGCWNKLTGFNENINWTQAGITNNLIYCAKEKYCVRTGLIGMIYIRPEPVAIPSLQWGPPIVWQMNYTNSYDWGFYNVRTDEIYDNMELFSNPDGSYPSHRRMKI